ncbi:urotensin-2 receptor [Nerophis lumbriciformis]|uniref:urotensin-2 receptor n=1 Tax=Nerophis lumbriciformis TaxID=546530 RepID=UPI002AE08AD3|nr:urotensin-2 receptor-like [Nerophis lumbriciformis]
MWLLGVAGNAYTLVVTRSAALRRTGSVYVYVANLALADLLYLSTIPFVVCTYFAHDWLFGEAGCRVLLSLDLLTMHASVFILVAMSLERYRAVARPFGARNSTPRRRKLAAAAIWATAFALTLPMMVMIRLREGKPSPAGVVKRMCFPTWTLEAFKAYVTALFLTSVLIPGLVIGGLYAGLARRYWAAQARLAGSAGSARRRGLKQRVVVMIFSIVVAYWACFLPFWAWQLAQLFSAESLKALSSSTHNYVNFFVTCLTYGNSCVNPFLYTLLTRNYKDYLAQKGQSTTSSRIEPLSPLAQLFSAESLKALSSSTHNYVNFLVTCLTYGNSYVNPFLYMLLTRNYKDYLAQKGQSTASSRTEPLSPGIPPPRTRSPGSDRILSVLSVAYWTCFLPFWAWQLAQLFSAESLKALSSSTHNYVNFLVTCLTYDNSYVNPFLYTLLTRNYKDYLAQKGSAGSLFGMIKP